MRFRNAGWLAAQFGVQVPQGVDPNAVGYAMFTWDSIGIIDHPSLQNITNEAWCRSPTTVIRLISGGAVHLADITGNGRADLIFQGVDNQFWISLADVVGGLG